MYLCVGIECLSCCSVWCLLGPSVQALRRLRMISGAGELAPGVCRVALSVPGALMVQCEQETTEGTHAQETAALQRRPMAAAAHDVGGDDEEGHASFVGSVYSSERVQNGAAPPRTGRHHYALPSSTSTRKYVISTILLHIEQCTRSRVICAIQNRFCDQEQATCESQLLVLLSIPYHPCAYMFCQLGIRSLQVRQPPPPDTPRLCRLRCERPNEKYVYTRPENVFGVTAGLREGEHQRHFRHCQ